MNIGLPIRVNRANNVRNMLNRGLNVNSRVGGNTLLTEAVVWNRPNIIRLLIERGAHVNARNLFGTTALMYASMHGREEIVRMLIKAGAHVNAVDDDKHTALWHAVHHGQRKTPLVLIAAGARVTEGILRLARTARPELNNATKNALKQKFNKNRATTTALIGLKGTPLPPNIVRRIVKSLN